MPTCSGAWVPGRCTRPRSPWRRRSSARPRRRRPRPSSRPGGDGGRYRSGHAGRQNGGRRKPQTCQVLLALADQLAALDPALAAAVCRHRGWLSPTSTDSSCEKGRSMRHPSYRPRRSVLYMPSKRAGPEKAKTIPCDALILDLRTRSPRRQGRGPVRPAPRCGRGVRPQGADHQDQRGRHAVALADLMAACAAGPDGIVVPKVGSRKMVHDPVRCLERFKAPSGPSCGRWSRPRGDPSARAARLRLGPSRRARHGHQRPGQGARGAARSRARAGPAGAVLEPRWPPGQPGSRSSTGSTTTSRTPRASGPSASRGRQMGFDGKTLIHPGQVDVCNEVFSPSEADVETPAG